MKVGIVTNLAGKGLQVDAELIEEVLQGAGHDVTLVQYDQPWDGEKFDLGISLEVVNQHLFSIAAHWWWIPNCEWLRPEYVRPAQRMFEKVLAKTRHAEKTLRSLFANVEYVGFMAKDRMDNSVSREDRCLHVGGDSGLKNTNEVLAVWREYRYWDERPLPPLTIVSKSTTVDHTETPGVTFYKFVSDDDLRKLQNSHRFHVLPSAYEGFGHSLHESQSVGAVILTTGDGPMHELGAPFEVPAVLGKTFNLGQLYVVAPSDLREMLPEMAAQPPESIAKLSVEARSRFEREREAFKAAFLALLTPSKPVARVTGQPDTAIAQKPRIALLGNFRPPHSTENDLLWSLRDLGYPTVAFQEDEDRTEEILAGCKDVALLIFVHTHGWTVPGRMSLDDLWKELQASGTKTCSFHLDKFWGLNEADGREDKIGTHPFWRTQRIFSADGSRQEDFRKRLGDDRHEWLPPGTVARDCHPGEYKKELAAEVGFVGAEGYHPEYSFRPKLIEFLRAVYGDRFRLYQGYRGEALGNVYASCPVFVGDSCFAGTRRYYSDRYYETPGRGGFLIVPQTEGYFVPGIPTFEPGNLYDLQAKIDWWLEHPAEREAARQVAWRWVRENETYTNRMTTLLSRMGINVPHQ